MGALKNLTIATTGDLGHKPEQLKKWVEVNGGRWIAKPGKGITHLVCSKEHWKRGVDAVTAAQDLGAFIVSYDWLEDSLHNKRKVAEKKYLWAAVSKERRKRKEMKRVARICDASKFKKGCQKALEDTESGMSPVSSRETSGTAPSSSGFFKSSLAALREEREKRKNANAQANGPAMPAGIISKDGVSEEASKADISNANEDGAAEDKQKQLSNEESPSRPPHPPQPPYQSSRAQHLPIPPRTQAPTASNPAPPQPPAPQTEKLTDNYHIHLDALGFSYDLTLLRANLHRNTYAKYSLRLFESNTKPHVYCTFIRYVPPPSSSSDEIKTTPSGIPILLPTKAPPPSKPKPKSKTPTNPYLASAIQALQTPEPKPEKVYRKLLTPMNSSFSTAFEAFRSAFLALTFLAWEHRALDSRREVQKQRARVLGIEPFVYRPPADGLPVGLLLPGGVELPASTSTPHTSTSCLSAEAVTEIKELVSRLGLPGMDVGLHAEGTYGGEIFREKAAAEEAARLAEEEKARKEKERGRSASAKVKVGWKERREWNRPLFNDVTGRGTAGTAVGYWGAGGESKGVGNGMGLRREGGGS